MMFAITYFVICSLIIVILFSKFFKELFNLENGDVVVLAVGAWVCVSIIFMRLCIVNNGL